MKIPAFKFEISLPGIAKKLFDDNPAQKESETPSAPELAAANAELKAINADIRDKDGRDVKHWKDVF